MALYILVASRQLHWKEKRSIKVTNMSATTDNSKRFVYWNSFPSLVLEIALPEGKPDIKFTQSYKIWETVRGCSRDLQTNKQDDGKITAVPVLSGMKFTGFRQTPSPWAIHLFSNLNDSLEATRSVYRLRANGDVFSSVFFLNKSLQLALMWLCTQGRSSQANCYLKY